jgi:hypothetical protein
MASNQTIAIANANAAVPEAAAAVCWICGVADANSGEHMIKKSDLRDVLGKPSRAAPFLFPQARPRREGRW